MKKEMGKISIKKVRFDAEEVFKSGKFLCAEAVLCSIAQNIAFDMPKEFAAAASGFSIGVGGSQCMCSCISAAVMSLGYFFGRDFPTTPTDPQSQKTLILAHELQASFKNKNKVLCCHIHNKGKNMEAGEHLDHCALLVGDAAAMAAEIIARELGFLIVDGGAYDEKRG